MNTIAVIGTEELLIVAIIGLVLFGGSQLPKLARNLGRAQKELQKGLLRARRTPVPGTTTRPPDPGTVRIGDPAQAAAQAGRAQQARRYTPGL